MRILSSTLRDSIYPAGDPHSNQHDTAARGGQVMRESVDDSGDYSIRVHAYTDPFTGTPRWAVVGDDPAEAEIVDFGNQTDAEAHYESDVRSMSTFSGWTFDTTDVN